MYPIDIKAQVRQMFRFRATDWQGNNVIGCLLYTNKNRINLHVALSTRINMTGMHNMGVFDDILNCYKKESAYLFLLAIVSKRFDLSIVINGKSF